MQVTRSPSPGKPHAAHDAHLCFKKDGSGGSGNSAVMTQFDPGCDIKINLKDLERL